MKRNGRLILRLCSAGVLVLVCAFSVSCDRKKKEVVSQVPKPPPAFADTEFDEITPMLDGSAYAKDIYSRLWYLRGNKAVRVTVVGDASAKLPEFVELTPVLDGAAYAYSWDDGSGLWHLKGEHAEKVTEAVSLALNAEDKTISERAFYALYLSERKKRKEAESRADNPPEPADYYYEEESDWR